MVEREEIDTVSPLRGDNDISHDRSDSGGSHTHEIGTTSMTGSFDSGVSASSSESNDSTNSKAPLIHSKPAEKQQDKIYIEKQTIDRVYIVVPEDEDSVTVGKTGSSESNSSASPLLNSGLTEKPQGTKDIEKQPTVNYAAAKDEDSVTVEKSFWKKVIIMFGILDVLLFATILVVCSGFPCRDNSTTDPSIHCLNCSDVYLTQDDKLDNIYNFTLRGDTCCSANKTLLTQKYVIKRYRSDQLKASAARDLPKRTSIHLDLDLEDENSIKEGSDQVLKWTKSNLMYGHLSLSTDRTKIVVGREGLYFISPQVVFDDMKGNISDADQEPMTLQLYREQGSDPQLLLESKESRCVNSDSKCSKPSSGQGVFKMERGDSVVVKVTKPHGLVLQNKLNHFDMYLI